MAFLLLNLKKSLVLKTNYITISERIISTTPPLLWFNKRLTRVESFNEKEKYFMEKDKVPQNYHLIYKAPMESYVQWAMHISTLTACLIGTAASYQFITKEPILEPISTTLTMEADDIFYFSVGFLAINTVLRLVTSLFALRIYKDQGKYLAVYHPQMPWTISHHKFERGQVKAVRYFLNPWNHITYKLGDKTSLLLESYFKTPSEFNEMADVNLKEKALK